jgi:anti-sigma B factor antagonist
MVRIAERAGSRSAQEDAVPEQGLSVDSEQQTDGAFRIALRGELDVATVPRFNAALANPGVRRCHSLIVDLSELTFMDSTGLSALLVGEMHARTRGQRFAIVRGPRHVQELFRLTGVDHFLEVIDPPA